MKELNENEFDQEYDHLAKLQDDEYERNKNFLFGSFFGSIALFLGITYFRKQ